MKTADYCIEVAWRAGAWTGDVHEYTLAAATRRAAAFARLTTCYPHRKAQRGPNADERLRAALRVIRIRNSLTGELWTPQFPKGAQRIKWVSSRERVETYERLKRTSNKRAGHVA